MTQAHLDLQAQLRSQNISNITYLTTTTLLNDSPSPFLEPMYSANTLTSSPDIK